MESKELENRLTKLETKVDVLCKTVNQIRQNEQRHVWALILMLAGTLLKALDIL